MKIAVLFNQFGPYHYARLNALGKKTASVGIEFFSKSDTYKWDSSGLDTNLFFEKKTLFTNEQSSTISKKALTNAIFQCLDGINPDVVAINGWSEAGAFAALKWCLLKQKPAIAMSESTEWDSERNKIKEFVKKKIVQNFSSAIVGGTPHKKYINKLGIPLTHIFDKYDVIDNEYFFYARQSIEKDINAHRQRLQLPNNFFLASARFIEKKNLEGLLTAYALYLRRKKYDGWDLVLLGDGEFGPKLNQLKQELKIEDKVLMPGFKQYDELPYYYTLANAFIHASTSEQWGLVVNEAMASGLPVLVSDRCGCAYDLVKNEVNGLQFDPYIVDNIADKMIRFSSGEYDLESMSQKSLEIIFDFSPSNFAENLIKAADKALNSRRKRSSFLDLTLVNFLIQK